MEEQYIMFIPDNKRRCLLYPMSKMNTIKMQSLIEYYKNHNLPFLRCRNNVKFEYLDYFMLFEDCISIYFNCSTGFDISKYRVVQVYRLDF